MLEQAEPELRPEDPGDGSIEGGLVHQAVRDRLDQGRPEGRRPRQLLVDTRLERERARPSEVGRELVLMAELLDAPVIRGDESVEPPLAAEDRRQEFARRVEGTPSTSP